MLQKSPSGQFVFLPPVVLPLPPILPLLGSSPEAHKCSASSLPASSNSQVMFILMAFDEQKSFQWNLTRQYFMSLFFFPVLRLWSLSQDYGDIFPYVLVKAWVFKCWSVICLRFSYVVWGRVNICLLACTLWLSTINWKTCAPHWVGRLSGDSVTVASKSHSSRQLSDDSLSPVSTHMAGVGGMGEGADCSQTWAWSCHWPAPLHGFPRKT